MDILEKNKYLIGGIIASTAILYYDLIPKFYKKIEKKKRDEKGYLSIN